MLSNKTFERMPPSAERLQMMYDRMRHRPGMPGVRIAAGEILKSSPSDLKEFRFKIHPSNQYWRGVLYRPRNSIYGSIFSFYGRTPVVIRGYPKIRYSEQSKVLYNECIIEEKLDGTNLILWRFHDGILMGKTRETPNFMLQGWRGVVWRDLLDETGDLGKIANLCLEGYEVAVELYGQKNPGDFIRYTIPIAVKVLDIVDRKTLKFVDYAKKVQLCAQYGLQIPKLMFRGLLSPKKLNQLEFEAQQYVVEDGMEGFVAKFFDPETKDVVMGKIKCKEVRERCWGMSPKSQIPRVFIAKAIRKAFENGLSSDSPEIIEFIQRELLEDFEQSNIENSMHRMKKYLEKKLILENPPNAEELFKYLKKLEKEGLEVEFGNKSKILSMANAEFPEFGGGRLYQIFCAYVSSKEEK